MVTYSFHLYSRSSPASFHPVLHSVHSMDSINWPTPSVWVFIAQLVELWRPIHCDGHIFISFVFPQVTGIISSSTSFRSLNGLNKLAYSQCMGLHSSAGRALQRERRGHGFESRWSPQNIFFRAISQLPLNCDPLRWSHTHFSCIPAVHIISSCEKLYCYLFCARFASTNSWFTFFPKSVYLRFTVKEFSTSRLTENTSIAIHRTVFQWVAIHEVQK